MKATRIAIYSVAVLMISACAPTPEALPDDIHVLPGKFAEEPVTKPLTAIEAFIGPDEFYLSYESEEGIVYSGGNWKNRVDLSAFSPDSEDDYAGPFILPLEYRQATRWAEIPNSPITPRLLSSKHWGRFTEQVFESVLPKADMTGIAMHFGDDDLFSLLQRHQQLRIAAPDRQARELRRIRVYRFRGVPAPRASCHA